MIVRKIFTAFRAFLNKLAGLLFKADRVSIYKLKIEEATEKVRRGTDNLAHFRGHISRLDRKLREDNKQYHLAKAAADRAILSGNETDAINAQIKLESAERALEATRNQLDSVNKQYKQQVDLNNAARQQIAQAQEDCKQLGLNLKLSKASRDAALLAAEMSDGMNDPLGEISGLREEIEEEIDANNAVMQVNSDLGLTKQPVVVDFDLIRQKISQRKAELGVTA